jgi:hypothetical protein
MSSPEANAGSDLAQAPPRAGGRSPLVIANIPENCARTVLQVDLDVAGRYLLPQVSNIGALRKMVHGDALVLSARGMGALVLDDFVAAALAAHAPFIVLSDGTVLTARQILGLPDRQIEIDGCQRRQSLDQWAENLAQIATAAGPGGDQQLASTDARGGLAALPNASGESGGARFQSEFFAAAFETAIPITDAPYSGDSLMAEPTPQSTRPINLINDLPTGGRQVMGGSSNDTLIFASIADTYDGGGGFDTLQLGADVLGPLDFSASTALDQRIENIDRLSLEGGNAVTVILDAQGVIDFEPDGNVLQVSGSAGDVIDLAEPIAASGGDAWVRTDDTATVDTWTYASSAGAVQIATLLVDNSVSVV